jgi:ATP-binding cassette subfamily B protein
VDRRTVPVRILHPVKTNLAGTTNNLLGLGTAGDGSMIMGYAWVRQQDQSDCGAAALASVALHYKLPIPVQRMRDLCGTDRVGTNLLGLLQAAESLGFSAKGVKGPFEGLREVPLPAIAHWINDEGLGHFVVLYGVRESSVVIADPARGIRKLSREEFCRQWTGYLLILTPDQARFARAEAGASTGPWRRFIALLRPHASILGEAFLCALLLTVLGLSTSFFVQHLVDSVLVHAQARLLNALAIGMLAILVFRALFGLLRQYLLVHISRKVDLGLISGYTRHVLRLPLNFFEMRRIGEILSRINDAVKVRTAVSGTSLTAIVDGTLVVISMAVMFYYDWRLAAVASLFVPLLWGAVLAHHPATKRLSRQAMEDGARLQAHLVEDVSAVETVKAFHLENARSEEGEEKLVKVVQAGYSLQKLGMSMSALGALVAGAAGIAILWYGGHRVIEGALSIGQLMFFSTLLGYMLGPLERLASVNLQLQDALIAVDRLYQVMDVEMEKLHEEKRAEFRGIRDAVELKNVSFKYGCRSEVLSGIDLRIPAEQTVAIVGESGSGKTTLLKLLMRFYDPTGGRITMDGVDARDFTLSSLRSRIGVVSQEPFIFNGTIAENIGLARPASTLPEIAAAARAVGLEEFIDGLPQRYETVVGERGANLSGGQRQRLAIARALLMRPEILVFDEATSHLDTATERGIQKGLEEQFRGKTVILVAHRLSTLRAAQTIYVLHQGKVVEQGSHEDLIRREGRYAALWRSQSDRAVPVNGHVQSKTVGAV